MIDFESLGLYDPEAAGAAERLELLEYLVGLGASEQDFLRYRDELPGLASVLALRGTGALTLSEAALRSGLSEEKLSRVTRAAGFSVPDPEDPAFSSDFADLAASLTAAEAIFGEDAVLQLTRVMGQAMSRIADAMVSAFLVNVEPTALSEDRRDLGVAKANAEATALIPAVGGLLEVLLRQHIISSRRSIMGVVAESGYETRRLAVGFVDLVGSTTLALRLSTRELGAVLTEFENLATDAVTAAGGRVVKLIGDEILFTAGDEPAACSIAFELARTFEEHPRLPAVRVGLACGLVTLRDGDVFGPVVNLAARAVKVAEPGEVVTEPTVASAAELPADPLGPRRLHGFGDDVELCVLTPPRAAAAARRNR
jgi:adenylate cyclase